MELIQEGFEVIIIDDLSNSKIQVLDSIEKITGIRPTFKQQDLRDLSALRQIISTEKPDSIIHFGAKKAVGESVEKPNLYYDINLNSTLNILKVMAEFNVPNLVFSSSCTVYGQPDKLPVTEQTPSKPAESPYGNTKKMCEDFLRHNCDANAALNITALRYFNPVGAHSSHLIGESPNGVPNNLLPFITQTAAGWREELKVFGGDYNTPDGSAVRDYIHVVDLAKAHVIALKKLSEGTHSGYNFYNVGTGKGASVLEVVNEFIKSNGVSLNYKVVARRPGDIEKIYADTTFANEELGWNAELGLKEMVTSAWEWQKKLEKPS